MTGSPTPDPWEVYALKYTRNDKPRRMDVMLGESGSADPMPMDYFIWVLRRGSRTVLVDLGFHAQVAARRNRVLLRTPLEALATMDLHPAGIDDIVITHLHFDHAGGIDQFPDTPIHLQASEMAFATGACMAMPAIGGFYEEDDVKELVRKLFRGQLTLHEGDDVLEPGLSVHWIGGHTGGTQVIRVWTRRGWLVLASDASHYFVNVLQRRPFTWTYNVGDHLLGFERLLALADSTDHLIPGHDPLVMEQYPPPCADLQGIVARLDADPLFSVHDRIPVQAGR